MDERKVRVADAELELLHCLHKRMSPMVPVRLLAGTFVRTAYLGSAVGPNSNPVDRNLSGFPETILSSIIDLLSRFGVPT